MKRCARIVARASKASLWSNPKHSFLAAFATNHFVWLQIGLGYTSVKFCFRDLLSTLLFFSIMPDNRPATQVRTVTVHEPTFNEQGA